MSRPKIDKKTETKILADSARRCCFCLVLNHDPTAKLGGQIAHINRRSSDNRPENLAYLCFEHHNLYDSKTSQAKALTPGELGHAKNCLLEYLKSASLPDNKAANRCCWVSTGQTVTYQQQANGLWLETHEDATPITMQEEARDNCMIVLFNRESRTWIRLHDGIKYWS